MTRHPCSPRAYCKFLAIQKKASPPKTGLLSLAELNDS